MNDRLKAKLAIIRGDGVRNCPFGLPIIDACKHAGKSVLRMAPLSNDFSDEENKNLAEANKLVYAYQKEDQHCMYADEVLENQDKVDCDFGDNGQGFHSTDFRGSPLYPQTFHGLQLDGLYGYPLGYYSDNDIMRNLPLGLWSLVSSKNIEQLVKIAENYEAAGQEDRAKTIDTLLAPIKEIKEASPEEFQKLENYLDEQRQKFKSEGLNPLLLEDLAQQYASMGKLR